PGDVLAGSEEQERAPIESTAQVRRLDHTAVAERVAGVVRHHDGVPSRSPCLVEAASVGDDDRSVLACGDELHGIVTVRSEVDPEELSRSLELNGRAHENAPPVLFGKRMPDRSNEVNHLQAPGKEVYLHNGTT